MALTLLAEQSDVEARLRRSLSADEEGWLEGVLEEASLLVTSFCGRDFNVDVPSAVRLVASRVAARGITSVGSSDEQLPTVVGPVQWPAPPPDAAGGGGWLTRADKQILSSWAIQRRVRSFETS